jgi:hypothetical protein
MNDSVFIFSRSDYKMESKPFLQLLVCVDDINLLGDNINTIKKNLKAPLDASKEVGLEVAGQKATYMFMFMFMLMFSRQNAG